MSFIPEITCRNCGKKFSALRGRCPSCGTRHVKQTLRTTPATTTAAAAGTPGSTGGAHEAASGTRWQMIFGGILVAAVIVAVIILISASLQPAAKETPVETPPLVDVSTPPPATPSPTPTPTPTVAVTSVSINFLGSPVPSSFTQRTTWAPIQLTADVYPREALTTATVTWRSSDDTVCTVDDTGLVTAVGPGTCEIICECGGIAAKCSVLVP